jgi:hypothetical protein
MLRQKAKAFCLLPSALGLNADLFLLHPDVLEFTTDVDNV